MNKKNKIFLIKKKSKFNNYFQLKKKKKEKIFREYENILSMNNIFNKNKKREMKSIWKKYIQSQ